MAKKPTFYDIVPKESKSIRNIPLPDKENVEEKEIIDSVIHHHPIKKAKTSRNTVKKHDHNETSSVEIKKLERPITNVDDYNKDEYVEIIDHTISDSEVTEEVHILGNDKEEIAKNKIPELMEKENFTDYVKNGGRGGGRGFFSGSYKLPIAIFIILFAVFLIFNYFSSATVNIKKNDLTVTLDPGIKFDKGDGEVLQATTSVSVSIPASGTVMLNKKAVGTVVIFNNSSASQKLTRGTRLQASNGLIYLLDSAVTVPAKKIVKKQTVMGSVTTTFTASEVGDKYNGGPKDFTLPGFKGTAKFTTIYGRSKGNITGGYSGEVPNISQADLSNKINSAKQDMQTDLLTLLKRQADSRDLIINNSTIQYKIINSPATLSSDKSQAIVDINGSVQASTLLNASIDDSAKEILGVSDTNGFSYKVNLASSSLSVFSALGEDQLTATGTIAVSISINKQDLAKALENKGKKEALSILQQTKGVSYAQIKTFPFWKMTLPKANRIKVLVQD